MDRRNERGRGMNSSPPRRIQISDDHGSSPGRRRQLPTSYRDLPKGAQSQGQWRNGNGAGLGGGGAGDGSGGGAGLGGGRGVIEGRRRSDGAWVPEGISGGRGRPGGSGGRGGRGTRDGGLPLHQADLRRIDVDSGGNGNGRAGYSLSPQEWNNRDSRELVRAQSRPVLIEPSATSAIGGRVWEKDRSPVRNGHRQKDWQAIGRSGSGGDGFSGGSFSGGGDRGHRYGNSGGGNVREDTRGHRGGFSADFVQGRTVPHVVAHESWDHPRGRPPSRERGGGNGHFMHGVPPGGWDSVTVQRDDSRPLPRNGVPNINGSRGQGRRSDNRSRSRTRDRGGGFHTDGRDRQTGGGRLAGDGGRGSHRRSSVDRRPRSLGRSLGRSRRRHAGGGSPWRDEHHSGRGLEYRNGGGSGGRGNFRHANGGGHGDFNYAGYAAQRRDNSRRRNEGRNGGGGWGGGKGGRHGRSSSGDDSAGSARRNGVDHSGGGDDQGHYKGKKGSIIGNRFEVHEDVGLGTFGRVLECWDMKRRRRVAVKVVRKVKKYHESALIEAQILRDVNQRERSIRRHPDESLCVEMLSQLEHMGHCCLVFECLGQSLYDFLKKNEYRGFPMLILRPIAQELLQAVEFLHSIKLIHTDLKPENVLLRSWEERSVTLESGEVIRVPASPHIKVIDFGGATYEHDSHASVVNTRQYRAPEVILGLRWLYPSDLWSVGCIIAELFLGDLLFATHNNMEHLALMEKCVGMFPPNMLSKAPRTPEFFDQATGKCKGAVECDSENRRHIRRMKRLQDITAPVESTGMGHLLEQLLTLDPKRRATATEALRHRFFSAL